MQCQIQVIIKPYDLRIYAYFWLISIKPKDFYLCIVMIHDVLSVIALPAIALNGQWKAVWSP